MGSSERDEESALRNDSSWYRQATEKTSEPHWSPTKRRPGPGESVSGTGAEVRDLYRETIPLLGPDLMRRVVTELVSCPHGKRSDTNGMCRLSRESRRRAETAPTLSRRTDYLLGTAAPLSE
jgi:hypothetical protein